MDLPGLWPWSIAIRARMPMQLSSTTRHALHPAVPPTNLSVPTHNTGMATAAGTNMSVGGYGAAQRAEKSVSVDFDGVIHQYSKGWHTKDIYDPPMAGAYEALIDLSKRYGVFILTARPAADVIAWCTLRFPKLQFQLVGDNVQYWDRIGLIGVTNRKLPALAYIDDRAIRFVSWVDAKNYFL